MTLEHVKFVSRKKAESMDPILGWAVISITTPGTTPASIRPGWVSLLRIEFDDVDVDTIQSPFLLHDVSNHYQLCTPEDVTEIVEWIRRWVERDVAGILVHCEQGESRSAAVAMYITEKYGLPPLTQDTTKYNHFVLRLLKEADVK